MVSKVTALPTEPQPLPQIENFSLLKNGAYMPYIVNVKSEFLIQTFFVWKHKTFNSEQKLGSF